MAGNTITPHYSEIRRVRSSFLAYLHLSCHDSAWSYAINIEVRGNAFLALNPPTVSAGLPNSPREALAASF
jgi:hypothetical protein